MARSFHRKDRLATLHEINLTPLIDLAFALLIIFMITTPLLEQTIQVNLPLEAAKIKPPPAKETFQSIVIDAEGRHYWGNQPVSLPELARWLDRIAATPVPPVLQIRADARLPYQKVVTVMDMIQKRKLSKINLDTKVSAGLRP